MSALLVEKSSSYQFSQCTHDTIERTLFNNSQRNNVLHSKYSCLSRPPRPPPQQMHRPATEATQRTLLTYARLAKRTLLAGLSMSLGEQCKLLMDDQDAYAVGFLPRDNDTNLCEFMRCQVSAQSRRAVSPLNGAWCQTDKVCYMGECVHLSVALSKVKEGKKSSSSSSSKSSMSNARTLRNRCPAGLSQEASSVRVRLRDYDAGPFVRPETCDQMLYTLILSTDPISWPPDGFCRSDVYAIVCCEKCRLYERIRLVVNRSETIVRRRTTTTTHSYCVLPTCANQPDNPCYNGATCITATSDNKLVFSLADRRDWREWSSSLNTSFRCECARGFRGRLCLQHDPCATHPCKRDEMCFAYGEFGLFHCLCAPDQRHYPRCGNEALERPRRRMHILFVTLFIVVFLVHKALVVRAMPSSSKTQNKHQRNVKQLRVFCLSLFKIES